MAFGMELGGFYTLTDFPVAVFRLSARRISWRPPGFRRFQGLQVQTLCDAYSARRGPFSMATSSSAVSSRLARAPG